VTVNPPDREGRRAILALHARGVPLAASVELDSLAAGTPGFVGADLANLVNEAALLAARAGGEQVTPDHLEAAMDRVLAGPARKGRILSPKERRIVAFHEAGHAIVAERCATAEPVRKISIVPRAIGALGFMQQIPDERSLLQHDELLDRLRVLLGGRAAETICLGQVSTGAANDLDRATALAQRMMCEFGMSPSLGPVRYGVLGRGPLRDEPSAGPDSPSSETIARIDLEVREMLDARSAEAREILEADREALESVAQALLEHETIGREEFLALLDAGRSVEVA
jgi:cell division protease FtsH